MNFNDFKDINIAVTSNHSTKINIHNIIISLSEFLDWKSELEKGTRSSYIQKTGQKKSKEGITTYYVCHRSGFYKSEGSRKRQLKSQGSCKIDNTCPAFITVYQCGEVYNVTYCKTHIGHNNDEIQHLRLNEEEQEKLAGQLAQGVSREKILDSIRDDLQGQLNRIHLTTNEDLANIERRYCINANGRKHENDETSVKMWVEEMRELGDSNPVLFFKSQNDKSEDEQLKDEDFCLIIMSLAQGHLLKIFGERKIVCVDTTHGINSYDFDLTTLMVVDNLGEGFPAAFMVSNRQDTQVMELFFSKLRDAIGVVSAQIFMSDITETFYTAWRNVMGDVQRLFCAWHIDRAWRKNLNKIKDAMKKATVYKTLRILLEETDTGKFTRILQDVIEQLNSDKDTKDFGEYFKEYYLNRSECWAYCYRKGAGINTNMYLESMHKTLKYIYLNGRKVKRLDKSICALMKLVRDKQFNRIIKLTKGKSTSRLSVIRRRHIFGVEIDLNFWQTSETTWTVKSENSDDVYEVEKRSSKRCCDMVCSECNICLHMFTCTCTDSLIKNVICKHIHKLVCKTTKEEKPVMESDVGESTSVAALAIHSDAGVAEPVDPVESKAELVVTDQSEKTNELQTHIKELSVTKSDQPTNDLQTLRASVETNIHTLLGILPQSSSKNILLSVNKYIRASISLVKLNKLCQLPKAKLNKEPGNKRIEKQARFYSTKKKPKKKENLKKPDISEKKELKSIFSGETLVTVKSNSEMHTYSRNKSGLNDITS